MAVNTWTDRITSVSRLIISDDFRRCYEHIHTITVRLPVNQSGEDNSWFVCISLVKLVHFRSIDRITPKRYVTCWSEVCCLILCLCVSLCVYSCRMPFQFCPQCGTKLQPGFRFCPSCGEKLPSPGPDEPITVSSTASLSRTPLKSGEAAISVVNTSLVASSASVEPTESKGKYLSQDFFMSNLVFHR